MGGILFKPGLFWYLLKNNLHETTYRQNIQAQIKFPITSAGMVFCHQGTTVVIATPRAVHNVAVRWLHLYPVPDWKWLCKGLLTLAEIVLSLKTKPYVKPKTV